MLRHYLTVAGRTLAGHKTFTALNLGGLALALAAFVFLFQYVRFERSYDGFHVRADQLYRLRNDHFLDGRLVSSRATTYRDAGPSLKADFPEVQAFARLSGTFGNRVVIAARQPGGRVAEGFEEKLFYADPSFLTLFTFPLRKGDPATALAAPFAAVLTEKAARRYFGNADPVGRTLTVDGAGPFTVTGVLADPPLQSHLQFDFLFSITSLPDFQGRYAARWSGAGGDVAYTYVQLRPGTNPVAFGAKLPGFLRKYQSEGVSSTAPTDALILQPVRDIHLHSDLELEAGPNGNATVVGFLWVAAVGVLLVAWMNYLNLATANAAARARDAVLRRVLGATRAALLGQLFFEALLVHGLAALAAGLLLGMALPLANTHLSIDPGFFGWTDAAGWGMLLAVAGAAIATAGGYPVTARASEWWAAPGGRAAGAGKGFTLRQVLIGVQFVVSVTFLCAALAVYRQLHYLQSRPLGIHTARTLVVQAPGVVDATYPGRLGVLKRELLGLGGIEACTASSEIPGKAFSATRAVARWGQPPGQAERFATAWVDDAFFPAYRIPLVAGRNFREASPADDSGVIVNELLVKALGLHSAGRAVGQRVLVQGAGECTILGVAADYHHLSPAQAVRPTAFLRNTHRNRRYVSLKLSPGLDGRAVRTLLRRVAQRWRRQFPANPFAYFFLDAAFQRQYQPEERLGRLLVLFAGLAVGVAAAGLFGLTLHTTRRRTKEVGIRKVLGASLPGLLWLLCREAVALFAAGTLVAWLLAYLGVQQWLASFALRVPLTPGLFLAPAAAVLLLTMAVVGVQTLRAALANPTDSLRQE
jgi:putative ABC transport system permease protein